MARIKTREPYSPDKDYHCRHCKTLLIIGKPGEGNITEHGLTIRQELICRECKRKQNRAAEQYRRDADKMHEQIRAEIAAMGPSSGPAQVQAEMRRQMERLSRPSGFNDWLEDQPDK